MYYLYYSRVVLEILFSLLAEHAVGNQYFRDPSVGVHLGAIPKTTAEPLKERNLQPQNIYNPDEIQRCMPPTIVSQNDNVATPLCKAGAVKKNDFCSEFSAQRTTKDKRCGFCENNKEPRHVFRSHRLKDDKGNLCCPILRQYKCPKCGATGDSAHTIKYCPLYRFK